VARYAQERYMNIISAASSKELIDLRLLPVDHGAQTHRRRT
jgi:hypothetical protein